MDQVIATIISYAVVLIAALGGGAIGAILTNRYAQRQDKRRKETEVIEELYELAIKVRFSVDAYLLAGPHSTLSDPVSDLMMRMTVLTDLYLQSLTPELEEFWDRIMSVEDAHKRQYNVQDGYGHTTKGNTDEFDQAKEAYHKSFNKLRDTPRPRKKAEIDLR